MDEPTKAFLSYVTAGDPIPLLVTSSPEKSDILEYMDACTYTSAASLADIAPEGAFYTVLTQENAQTLYAFAAEYPGRDIRMTYRDKVYPVVDTSKLNVIFVVDKETLSKLEENGLDFLSICGITHQVA